MNIQFVTNNLIVRENYEKDYRDAYYDVSGREILAIVHAMCLKGYRLLTHPLAGSVSPRDMPYRSVILQRKKEEVDYESVALVEKSLHAYDKFVPKKAALTADVLKDFRVLDAALMQSAVEVQMQRLLLESKKKAITVVKRTTRRWRT